MSVLPFIRNPQAVPDMLPGPRTHEPHLSHKSRVGSLKRMAAVACRQATRLLWEYVEALGESNRAHADYVEAIRLGSRASIRKTEKVLKERADSVKNARQAFQEHAREHGCQGPLC